MPGGLMTLTLLSFCTTDGSEVQWQEIDAHGTAPSIGLWHHQAAPFDGGEKVCVFGGDMPREDAEFDLIADRQAANLIYVLHVARAGGSAYAPSATGRRGDRCMSGWRANLPTNLPQARRLRRRRRRAALA